MVFKKEIISLGRINQNLDEPETQAVGPENVEQNVENKDQKSLEISYLQKQIAAYEAYKKMLGFEKGTDDYKRLREEWIEKRAEIAKHEKNMPAELLEEYASKYNSSEAKARKRLKDLDSEQTAPDQQAPEEVKDKKWMALWGLEAGEKLPKDVTEPDIRKYIEMKKNGMTTLSQAYAENLLNDLQEQPVREEAEAHRDEVEELEAQEADLQKQLQDEKSRELHVFEGPNDAEVSKLEKQIKAKEQQVEEKKEKSSWGEKFKKGVKGFFDKFKRENKREEKKLEETTEKLKEKTPEEKIASGEEYLDENGFIHNRKEDGFLSNGYLNERVKGFVGGFGWWESHQAEKFRLGTKETGADAKAQAKLLEQEEGLLEAHQMPGQAKGYLEGEAIDEAFEIEAKRAKEEEVFKKKSLNEREARIAAVIYLSDEISQRKKEYNQKTEDKIISMAMAKLEEKIGGKEWFEAYKAANGGRALTSEKAAELESLIRGKIGELRKGQAKKDLVDFTKLARQSLDKNWWHRYVYTGVDAVLAGLMLKWVVGKYLGGKAVAGAEKIAAKGGAKAVESGGETGLKDTIWGEAKRMLIKDGIANPTNTQIQQVATEIAKDSGVKVVTKSTGEVIWQATKAGAKGIDVALQKGFLLKLAGAAKKIAMIRTAL